jgi:hypothetical protein
MKRWVVWAAVAWMVAALIMAVLVFTNVITLSVFKQVFPIGFLLFSVGVALSHRMGSGSS